MKSGTPRAWHKGGTPEEMPAVDNVPATAFSCNWLLNLCLLPDWAPKAGPVLRVIDSSSTLGKARHGAEGRARARDREGEEPRSLYNTAPDSECSEWEKTSLKPSTL